MRPLSGGVKRQTASGAVERKQEGKAGIVADGGQLPADFWIDTARGSRVGQQATSCHEIERLRHGRSDDRCRGLNQQG